MSMTSENGGALGFLRLFLLLVISLSGYAASAQELTVNTVTRPPFSMVENGRETGFSIDLLDAVARELGWDYSINRVQSFSEMLDGIENGNANLAVANISITSAREVTMDFSHPIFESGLQIMVAADDAQQMTILKALWSWDVLAAIAISFAVLFLGGMAMWFFERRAQPYFDRPLKEAWFPSFWWALNLVVNGGFEERVPRTAIGRMFGVILVVSSLFVVSVFVAKITTVMTVEAISGSVNTVNDLYGKKVGTIRGSTAAGFLDRRELDYRGFADLDALIEAFETDKIRVVVFDAPVLKYYLQQGGDAYGRMVNRVFLRENYGIAMPAGSPLVEDVNRTLLTLQEDGTYDRIYSHWFGRQLN